jgi:hypothetical protein
MAISRKIARLNAEHPAELPSLWCANRPRPVHGLADMARLPENRQQIGLRLA